MRSLNIGVVGTGRIGKIHAANIATRVVGANVVAVTDVVPESAKALAEQLGITKVYADYKALIADPEIDAVFVCSSTDTHSIISYEAVMAGKHVFCEKPIDFDLERINKVIRAVEEKGVKFQVGFNRRFDRNFKRVRDTVQAGTIGDPHIVMVTSRDPAPPPVSYVKVSGGIFLDMMIHDFDMANFIMGAAPVTVSAVGTSIVDPAIGEAGDVDTAIITLRFESGAIGVIDNSRKAVYGYDQRVELLGSEGLLQAQNMLENTVVKSTTAGVVGAKPTYFFLERYMPAYAAEWAAFVAAVTAGSALPVTLDDGVAALAMAEAATRSATTGLPVKLSEILGA